MKHRLTAFAMAGILSSISGLFFVPATVAESNPEQLVAQRPTTSKALQGLAATGTSNFQGTVSITKFDYANGTLLASGVLNGTAVNSLGETVILRDVPFSRVASTLSKGGQNKQTKQLGSCDILILDIGAISLDLLGLNIDLAPISLDVVAQSGPGNLLGNLLCGLVGLLDQGGPLSGIIGLLDQINNILASL